MSTCLVSLSTQVLPVCFSPPPPPPSDLDIYTITLSVGVSKLQVAILARSSREMSQTGLSTESTSCYEFASQVGLTIFLYAKTTRNLWETGSPERVFIWMNQRPAIDRQQNRQKRGVNSITLGPHRTATTWTVTVVCTRVCVWCVCNIRYYYLPQADNDKNKNCYPFVQITHTHWWFPLNGYPATNLLKAIHKS